jgi:hypothetical protein
MTVEEFLADQHDGSPWRYHFNAMFTSYCAKPHKCGNLVRPGDNYYHCRKMGASIHASCALAWMKAATGETDANV